MKPLELKARLLCEGANPENTATTEFLRKQNPQGILRGGLSSGLKAKLRPLDAQGKPQQLPRELRVNFPLYSKIPVSLKIRAEENGIVVLENEKRIAQIEIIEPPSWYDETIDEYPITSIVTQHGDQLTGSVYEWCSLFNTGEQCRFCVMDKSQKIDALKNVRRKAELLIKAFRVIPRETYGGVTLNGGMTFSEGRGLEVMIPVVRQIREAIGNLSIAVEMTPPKNTAWIERFAEAGGESLMMNLETWDDEIRKRLIPGKTKYCPKDSYFRAFEKAVKVLGKGKVSTCFIVGTESLASLKEGIQKVVEYDVIPSPLAGRYFEQFPDYAFDSRVDFREFLEAFRFTRVEMAKRNLLPNDTAGCVACGMCDIIGDNVT